MILRMLPFLFLKLLKFLSLKLLVIRNVENDYYSYN
jgi:hypothetical protein